MLILQVYLKIKPEFVDQFLAATIENSRNSVQEPGCARFDVLQQKDDPTKFVFHEVYRSESDLEFHRTAAHYQKWRDTVPDMFAEPRYSVQLTNAYPGDSAY